MEEVARSFFRIQRKQLRLKATESASHVETVTTD